LAGLLGGLAPAERSLFLGEFGGFSVVTDVNVVSMIRVAEPTRETNRTKRMPQLVWPEATFNARNLQYKSASWSAAATHGLTVNEKDVRRLPVVLDCDPGWGRRAENRSFRLVV
jgi:hypothetical protein